MKSATTSAWTLAALVALAACERAERRGTEEGTQAKRAEGAEEGRPTTPETVLPAQTRKSAPGSVAEADIQSARGKNIDGDAKLEEVPGGVKVVVELEDSPAGNKGIHIHEKGDCSDIPGQSMGKHFAPTMKRHGLPSAKEHHLGDLGNITIDQDGEGRLEITVLGANLKPNDPHSFLGKAIVIHEGEDKGLQPSGGSGTPMACGVIKAS